MGLYIKDIEMPTGNDEVRLIIHSNGQVIISHKTYFDETEAILVPPYGRLIDADALLNDLFTEDYKEHPFCYPCGEIICAVKNAPVILEAEEE